MEEKSLAISLNSGIKSCEIFFGSVDISQGRRIEGSRWWIIYKLPGSPWNLEQEAPWECGWRWGESLLELGSIQKRLATPPRGTGGLYNVHPRRQKDLFNFMEILRLEGMKSGSILLKTRGSGNLTRREIQIAPSSRQCLELILISTRSSVGPFSPHKCVPMDVSGNPFPAMMRECEIHSQFTWTA